MNPNILFIVVDSLRADKFYGDQKTSVTPNIDNWMKDTIPEKYKEIVIKSVSQKKWSNIIEAFKQELVFGTS